MTYRDDPRYVEMVRLLRAEGFSAARAKRIAADAFVRQPHLVDRLLVNMRKSEQRKRKAMH